jgi:DNA polymerase-4
MDKVMDRIILHVDLNNFYASVECLYNPLIRDVPFAVTGIEEERHGIILAKNYAAKAYGIKTGDMVLNAWRKCLNQITQKGEFEKFYTIQKNKAML